LLAVLLPEWAARINNKPEAAEEKNMSAWRWGVRALEREIAFRRARVSALRGRTCANGEPDLEGFLGRRGCAITTASLRRVNPPSRMSFQHIRRRLREALDGMKRQIRASAVHNA
jgi:hypothetical protein